VDHQVVAGAYAHGERRSQQRHAGALVRREAPRARETAQVVADDRCRDAGEKLHERGIGLHARQDSETDLIHGAIRRGKPTTLTHRGIQ
jgi:hypothetical protein